MLLLTIKEERGEDLVKFMCSLFFRVEHNLITVTCVILECF